jgi:transcriptional regulator with XRE-family HTH domain
MQTTKQLLDRAKKAQGIESDYKLAQVLGVVNSAVTNYRAGRSHPDDAVAARLAELAGQDPSSVIAELHAERAKTPEVRALWLRMANQLRHAVAAVMLAVGAAMVLIAGSPTAAEAGPSHTVQNHSSGLCIM